MNAIVAGLRELWGLFVEDASFTDAIAVCLLLAYLGTPAAGIAPVWRGVVLFVLLAAALIENVWRTAHH